MKLFVVDDWVSIQEIFQLACTIHEPEFELVGVCGDGAEAVSGIRRTQPDCVVLDLELPGMSGFEILAALNGDMPSVRFLILSEHCTNWTVYLAQQFGISGYIDKPGNGLSAILDAIRIIGTGGTFYSTRYQSCALQLRQSPGGVFSRVLSNREMELLPYFAEAMNDGEIAAITGLAESTVSCHRQHVMHKLGVASTPKLMKYALDAGFIRFQPSSAEAPVPVFWSQ